MEKLFLRSSLPVVIGDGCWIGANATISGALPQATELFPRFREDEDFEKKLRFQYIINKYFINTSVNCRSTKIWKYGRKWRETEPAPVLTSRPRGIFRITVLKPSVGPGNMKYCRDRLSLKVNHADAGSGHSDIRDCKMSITGIMHIKNTRPIDIV